MTQFSNHHHSPKSLENSRHKKKVVFSDVVQSRYISKTDYYYYEEQLIDVDRNHSNLSFPKQHSLDVFISYCSPTVIHVPKTPFIIGNNSWGIACAENGLRYHYRSVENVLDPVCLQDNRTTLKQIHHSVCCRDPYCSLAHCAHGKEAWNHLQADQNRSRCSTTTTSSTTTTPSVDKCDYYHCTYLKRILLHFQGCKDRFGCPLCSVLHVKSENGKHREIETNSEEKIEGNEENQRVIGGENIVNNIDMTNTRTDLETKHISIETKLKRRSKETLREVKLHLVLVNHAKNCDGSANHCVSANCAKMRSFLAHPQECSEIDCTLCRRVNNLLKLHGQVCSDRDCSLAVCCQKVGRRSTTTGNRKVSSTSSLGSKFDRIALNN
jgi:hypothetical protein